MTYYEGYGLTFRLPAKCKCCKNKTNKIFIHHKDGSRKNNQKENLVRLCKPCFSYVNSFRDIKVLERTLVKELLDPKAIDLIVYYTDFLLNKINNNNKNKIHSFEFKMPKRFIKNGRKDIIIQI